MKKIILVIQFFVGIVFIISGFVKLIDPLGFSFKLQEYFSPDVLNLPFFEPYAFALALVVVIVEILLGALLLLGYQKKLTLYVLILLTVFFAFLTFYSAYFNKVTDCGCFGDAIKFTPWQSFLKDVFLLALILVLYWKKELLVSLLPHKISLAILGVSLLFCGIFAYYTYHHLPVVDFRPYKVGANIEQGMQIPEGGGAIIDYHWKFNVNGKEQIITTRGEYPQVEGNFVSVDTEIISEGQKPAIHDFTIEKDGQDYTQQMLKEPKLLMVVSYDFQKADLDGFRALKELTDRAVKQGITVIGMTPAVEQAQQIKKKYELNFDFYFTDPTTLKTMIRANPGVIYLENGTIMQKANYTDAQRIKL